MAIVEALLGKAGMIIFGVVVGLACVTTAIGLTSSAAAYFTELCSEKVPYKAFVIVICVFSAVASNLGLDRIVSIAAPVLDIVYPPALVVIFISLIIPKANDYVSRGAALGAVGASILCAFKVPEPIWKRLIFQATSLGSWLFHAKYAQQSPGACPGLCRKVCIK